MRSATFRDGILIVNTYIGLRMRVEASIWVSGVQQHDDLISIHGTDPDELSLSATVTVPPGFDYESNDIVSMGEVWKSCADDKTAIDITTVVGKVKIHHMGVAQFDCRMTGKRFWVRNTAT